MYFDAKFMPFAIYGIQFLVVNRSYSLVHPALGNLGVKFGLHMVYFSFHTVDLCVYGFYNGYVSFVISFHCQPFACFSFFERAFGQYDFLDGFGAVVCACFYFEPYIVLGLLSEVFRLGNVVFACGLIREGDRLDIYYGASDDSVCMASITIQEIWDLLGV